MCIIGRQFYTVEDGGGNWNLKIKAYVHFRPPVAQLYVAAEEDDRRGCNLKINLYLHYRPPALQLYFPA